MVSKIIGWDVSMNKYLNKLEGKCIKGQSLNGQYILNKNLKLTYQKDIEYGSIHLTEDKINFKNNYTTTYIKSLEDYCLATDRKLVTRRYKTLNKLAIGLGDQHVKETNLTLHHIYGIPYIPGQAFKGNVRHCFLDIYYDLLEKEFKDNNTKMTKIYKYIFGDTLNIGENEKGHIIFFDAYPVNNINIEKDVMTPHIGTYYDKGIVPDNRFKANPIFFYTVCDTEFEFAWAINEQISEELTGTSIDEICKIMDKVIKTTIEDYGIGAKTSVNYGYFSNEQA